MNGAQPTVPWLHAEYTVFVGLLHIVSLQISRLLVQTHHYPTTETELQNNLFLCFAEQLEYTKGKTGKINAAGLYSIQSVYTLYGALHSYNNAR
jgi:hypothetical protein